MAKQLALSMFKSEHARKQMVDTRQVLAIGLDGGDRGDTLETIPAFKLYDEGSGNIPEIISLPNKPVEGDTSEDIGQGLPEIPGHNHMGDMEDDQQTNTLPLDDNMNQTSEEDIQDKSSSNQSLTGTLYCLPQRSRANPLRFAGSDTRLATLLKSA